MALVKKSLVFNRELGFSSFSLNMFNVILLFSVIINVCKAGVTEIPPDLSEAIVETVTDESWMPSNIFDVKANPSNIGTSGKLEENGIENVLSSTESLWNTITDANPFFTRGDLSGTEAPWDADASPIFKAIRDFIFQASDGGLEHEEERNEDPTEEIVKIIEKGLIEATTIFFSPTEEITTTPVATTEEPQTEISIVKIENVSPDTMLDRIGLNVMDLTSSRQALSVTNTTTACSDCYDTLQTCVQMCFAKHNCHDVQRQARVCPPPSARLCNIFTQWGPVDECTSHEDCTSPLLCCNDGCINKCSPGVWQN